MRRIGFLLLLAGIGLGILWPWAQLNFTGDKLVAVEFDKLDDELVDPRELFLDSGDNPVRLRFQAVYKVGGKLPPVKIPVRIQIYDMDGLLVDAVISFPTNGRDTGPEQPKVAGSQAVEFDVLKDGKHTLTARLANNPNDGGIRTPDIEKVIATVVTRAPALRDDFKILAVALAMTGIYLLLRGRRRRKDKNRDDRPPPSKPPVKWGRG